MTVDAMLKVERHIPAPPEKVFLAWTDPALLAQWWGPPGYTVPEAECDLREGGAWRIAMLSPGGDPLGLGGAYLRIEPPRRLAFTWAWLQDDGGYGDATEVQITFEPAESGTLLTLTHKHFQTEERRDSHRMGWGYSLDSLETYFNNHPQGGQ